MITGNLKGAANAPLAASEIARKTIVSGITSTKAAGQNPKETLEEICYGAMSGIMLIESDLPQTAVLILKSMNEVAHELHMDPSELMTWAMGGIARISAVTPLQTSFRIREAIEEEYQGAGEVFGQLCAPYSKT
ncbi:MAG: hypothetical protein HY078_13175 [Elusimicrobia bacterium]|nr:hypothetical protein [Elusimicrobiota bacterium]